MRQYDARIPDSALNKVFTHEKMRYANFLKNIPGNRIVQYKVKGHCIFAGVQLNSAEPFFPGKSFAFQYHKLTYALRLQ